MDERFVEREQMFDALAVGREGRGAVEPVDGDVEVAVRLAKLGGHGVGIVEVGERRGRVLGEGSASDSYARLALIWLA